MCDSCSDEVYAKGLGTLGKKSVQLDGSVRHGYREKLPFMWTLKSEFKKGQVMTSSGRKMWSKCWRQEVPCVFPSISVSLDHRMCE